MKDQNWLIRLFISRQEYLDDTATREVIVEGTERWCPSGTVIKRFMSDYRDYWERNECIVEIIATQ